MSSARLPDPVLAVPAPPGERGASRLGTGVRAILGLVVALALTEAAFRARDGAAFPLVNIYERDPDCGVRLRRLDSVRVGSRASRVVEVRTNAEGFRGPAWPPESGNETVVVGDSLTFGLGVDETERLPSALARARGRVVLDASVPTYGPREYKTVLERILAVRTPATVVVTLNLMNDLSELSRPNARRHTAVDGWAARIDGSGELPATSSFREHAIRASHAAFAAWRWGRTRSATRGPQVDEVGELLAVAHDVAGAGRRSGDATARARAHAVAIEAAAVERSEAEAALVTVAAKAGQLVRYSGALRQELASYVRGGGDPSDEIFTLDYGGCAALVNGRHSYRARFTGARIRADVEEDLRGFATRLRGRLGESLASALARRDAADARLAEAREAPISAAAEALPPLSIAPFLESISALARAHGARLVVLIVPLDAQSSEAARERRGIPRGAVVEMETLTARIAETARAVGAIANDPSVELRRLDEEAYLPDGHLAPRGHLALAELVAGAR